MSKAEESVPKETPTKDAPRTDSRRSGGSVTVWTPFDSMRQLAAAILVIALAAGIAYVCAPHCADLRRRLPQLLERYGMFWSSVPAGHGLPIGSHQPALAERLDELHDFPHPIKFFRRYVRPQRPVIFRGLAKVHPAFHLWTDQYFRDKFGYLVVEVEQRKKEDRNQDIRSMNLSHFLSVYTHQDIYVVDRVQEELKHDVAVPRSVQCGGMQHALMDTVMWFSSGGTRSVLHYDELDNINCVLDGYKQLFLVDVDDADHIHFDKMDGRYSSVDVDRVDMYKFPGLRDVPWYNVTLEKGDCLYIPFKWPHQVRSSNSRNVAVNLWFARLLWMNETDCQGKKLVEATPLSDFDAHESGNLDKVDLIYMAADFEQLTVLAFTDIYGELVDEGENAAEEAFDQLDADRNGLLHLSEMYGHDTARFLRLFPRYIQGSYL